MKYAGTYMGFYGAAWDGNQVRVEPLAEGIDLATNWKRRNTRDAMASYFDAFVLVTKNIEEHYKSIEAKAQAHQTPLDYDPIVYKARQYPFLTSYDDNGTKTSFIYKERLYENKLVFSATVNQPGSGEYIVKFTSRYSEAAHNFLASCGLAPKVHKCIQISVDWTAVVMDMSKYQVLHNMGLSKAEQEKVAYKVRFIVQLLHNRGFVHGNIRDSKILVNGASLESDNVEVHLIGFNWAGCCGEVKFPVGMGHGTLRRPEGVEARGGEVITEQHDNKMVSYLFGN